MVEWKGEMEEKSIPPATRIDVLIGPCQRGNPGNRGAGVVVVRGGGGGGDRDRASDGMVVNTSDNN